LSIGAAGLGTRVIGCAFEMALVSSIAKVNNIARADSFIICVR
jgi:hypothetical protein